MNNYNFNRDKTVELLTTNNIKITAELETPMHKI